MDRNKLLDRIVVNPNVVVGKPVIRETRITVQHILNLLSHGETPEEILQEYNGLTRDDILACIMFAEEVMKNTSFAPLVAEVV